MPTSLFLNIAIIARPLRGFVPISERVPFGDHVLWRFEWPRMDSSNFRAMAGAFWQCCHPFEFHPDDQ
eukprot:11220087-Lingulodinium_polyedra.AAC.1